MHDPLDPARRVVVRRLAPAAPLAGAAAAGAYESLRSPEHPDAALLELGRELDAAWAAERVARDDDSDPEGVLGDAAADVSAAVAHRIEKVPARTLDGLLVKARAVAWCVCGDEFTPEEDATTDLRLAHGIVEDLRRIAGEGRA